MRHYFGYDGEGNLRSIENYGPSGWPTTHRLEDPDCSAEAVVSLRERRRMNSPDIVGFILFDCPCDASQGYTIQNCSCCNQKFAENLVDMETKTFARRPTRTVYIDDQAVVANGEVVTRAPGTVVMLKVVADVADGITVHCIQKGAVDLTLDDEWDLTFTNGETDTKPLTAPAQGTKGAVALGGGLIQPFYFVLRGFAQ